MFGITVQLSRPEVKITTKKSGFRLESSKKMGTRLTQMEIAILDLDPMKINGSMLDRVESKGNIRCIEISVKFLIIVMSTS